MPIHRRSAVRQGNQSRLRHPMLAHGKMTATIYRYIERNPGCTHKDIRTFSSSSQPITDLVNEGLITKEGHSRASYKYFVVPENETGRGRDSLDVEVVVFVNDFGEYSIAAKLYGQRLSADEDNPVEVLRRKFKIHVPRDTELYETRDIQDIDTLQTFAKPQSAGLSEIREPITIDVEFTRMDTLPDS